MADLLDKAHQAGGGIDYPSAHRLYPAGGQSHRYGAGHHYDPGLYLKPAG